MKVLVFKDIKNNRWTLWSLDRKNHLGYRKTLNLKNCELVVIQEKRQQVIKTKKRFPHAWIIGTIAPARKKTKQITYNPFKNKTFMSQNRTIHKAQEIHFSATGHVFKA